MTTPIRKQPSAPLTRPSGADPTACTLLYPAGWECSLAEGHPGDCVPTAARMEPPPVTPAVGSPAAAPSPSAAPEAPQPVAPASLAQPGGYFFPRMEEFDLEVPSGGKVRCRKIRDGSELQLDFVELLDSFTPELLSAAQDDDSINTARAVAHKETRAKLFGPINAVVVAAVVSPKVVAEGPTTDTQINVTNIDVPDRIAIFNAAFGEQLSALKSLLSEQADGVRDVPAGQSVRQEPE